MIAIIDVNHSFHKSFFVFKKWDNSDLNTEFGQGRLMRKAVTDLFASVNKLFHKPEDVFFCFDSHAWRKQFNSEYKADRSGKEEGFYTVINTLYEIMKEKGYKALKVDGAESDDCIAFLTKADPRKKIIISADEDMHQLLNKNVVVWNNNVKKPILFTDRPDETLYFDFKYETKLVNPRLSLFKKIMLGCSGDNVSALIDKKGVGEKTIEKLYTIFNGDENFLFENTDRKALEETISRNLSYQREDFQQKFEENLSLVFLHPSNLPEIILDGLIYEYDSLIEKPVQNYSMESLLNNSKFFLKNSE